MKYVARLAVLLSLLGLCIASGQAQAAEIPNSGITVEVFIYTCPVVRPGDECLHPFPASITVRSTNGRIVKRFTTDAEGHYQVSLKPGRYVLVPASPNGRHIYPLAEPMRVRVTRNAYTPATIIYDSGIR